MSASVKYPPPKRHCGRWFNPRPSDLPVVPDRRRRADIDEFLAANGTVGLYDWVKRFKPKFGQMNPALAVDTYRDAVANGVTAVRRLDPRTYVAQIFDPMSQAQSHGVDGWVVVQSSTDRQSGELSHVCCSWCPDKNHYGQCLHELLLDAAPDTVDPLSTLGKQLLPSVQKGTHAAVR